HSRHLIHEVQQAVWPQPARLAGEQDVPVAASNGAGAATSGAARATRRVPAQPETPAIPQVAMITTARSAALPIGSSVHGFVGGAVVFDALAGGEEFALRQM
ncbi:MAG: hypothetical protein ACOYK7_06875, partial [Pirellulales bacterium]